MLTIRAKKSILSPPWHHNNNSLKSTRTENSPLLAPQNAQNTIVTFSRWHASAAPDAWMKWLSLAVQKWLLLFLFHAKRRQDCWELSAQNAHSHKKIVDNHHKKHYSFLAMTHIMRCTNTTYYQSSTCHILTSKDRFIAPKITFFVDTEANCISVSRKEAAYTLRKFRKVRARKNEQA